MFSLTFDVAVTALLLTLVTTPQTHALPLDGTAILPWNSLATTTQPETLSNIHTHPKRDLDYHLALPLDFPDPSIYKIDDRYWAFATTNDININIQLATSSDFVNWVYLQDYDALPFAGAWTFNITSPNGWQNPRVWAPNVIQNDDGLWVMYYAALATSNIHCTGVATATNIQGPYLPVGDDPLVCPGADGGAIDASGFQDVDGTRWLVYKVDGNSLVSIVPA